MALAILYGKYTHRRSSSTTVLEKFFNLHVAPIGRCSKMQSDKLFAMMTRAATL